MPTTLYAIALGSNRRHGRHGAPAGVIAAAIGAMEEQATIVAASRIRATPALGPAGRGFANAVILIRTRQEPPDLLALLKRMERAFGRRPGRRWGARVLDLDIILWSGGSWPSRPRKAAPGRLAIPHPQFARRAFVLGPLAEIAPGWRDPVRGLKVAHSLFRLGQRG